MKLTDEEIMKRVDEYAIATAGAYETSTPFALSERDRLRNEVLGALHVMKINAQHEFADSFDLIDMWQVRGIHGHMFSTKIEAERVARGVFPEEDPDVRYGRIFYTTHWREKT